MLATQTQTVLRVKTLADKAVLVRLRRSMWVPYAFDRKATAMATQAAGVADAGRFNKNLMKGCPELKTVQATYSAVYSYLRENTLPWLDDGLRLLRADQYLDVTAGLRQRIADADAAVAKLAQVWSMRVAQDMQRLGSLASVSDYPVDIAAEYAISVGFYPVPTTGDFRVGIGQEDVDSLQKELELAEKQAAKYVIEQLLEPMQAAVKRLSEYTGAPGQRFHDSTLANILEVATRMERVNISDDPQVAAAIRAVKHAAQSAVLQAESVKSDATLREAVRNEVQALAEQFAGLV